MGSYSPVLLGGSLEEQIDMNRTTANTVSELRSQWASRISLWSFLAHLDDLDFYKGLDEQREICIAPSASRREGVHGKRSWPIECVGERLVNFSQESVEQSDNDSRGITYTSRDTQ
jgi:hypothetical protein